MTAATPSTSDTPSTGGAPRKRRFHTIPLDCNKFLGGTMALTLEGTGAYIKVMCLLYPKGGRLALRTQKDEQDLCRRMGLANPRTLRRALRELILVERKVEVEDGLLMNRKVDAVLGDTEEDEADDQTPTIRGASAYVRQILGLPSGDDRPTIGGGSSVDRPRIDGGSAGDRPMIDRPSAEQSAIIAGSSGDDRAMIAGRSGNRPPQAVETPDNPTPSAPIRAEACAPVSIQHSIIQHSEFNARARPDPVENSDPPQPVMPERRTPRFVDFVPVPEDTAFGGPERRARLQGWAHENLTGGAFGAWLARIIGDDKVDAARAFDEIESQALLADVDPSAAGNMAQSVEAHAAAAEGTDSQAPAADQLEEARQAEAGRVDDHPGDVAGIAPPVAAGSAPATDNDALLDLPAFLDRRNRNPAEAA